MLALNRQTFKKLPGSRESAFAEMDRPALRPLPETVTNLPEWKVATVGIDYHVEFDHHYYSVPYRFARQKVDARATQTTVELFHHGSRICQPCSQHPSWPTHDGRCPHDAGPPSRSGLERPCADGWAGRIGAAPKAVIEHVLHQRRHPQQGYRSCLGILRLSKTYGESSPEAACARAIDINALSHGSLKSIFKHGLDIAPDGAGLRPAFP